MWELCAPFFSAEFVVMVRDILKDAPLVEFWQRLDALERQPDHAA